MYCIDQRCVRSSHAGLFTNLKEDSSSPPEDPFVWQDTGPDGSGVLHGLFHDRSCPACGGHGYSLDGVSWAYTVSKIGIFSHLCIKTNALPRQARDRHRKNSKKRTVFPQGIAYNGTTEYTDGSTECFSRRERPHLVFRERDDGGPPIPIALTNGVQYGSSDATFTLLQPLNAAPAAAAGSVGDQTRVIKAK
jgi:hypothetical protein